MRRALILGLLVLAGCGPRLIQMTPDPAGPAFITTMSPSVGPAAIGRCVAFLDAQVSGEIAVVGTAFAQANSAVYMTVGPSRAPWRCLVAHDGTYPVTEFMGRSDAL